MHPMSVTEFGNNIDSALNLVADDLEKIVITRSGGDSVVVLPLGEYESLEETAYLLGNFANASHLARGIFEHRAGGGEVHDLIEFPNDAAE